MENQFFETEAENSILYTKVEKFMIIARAPRLEGYKELLHRGLYTIFSLLDTLKPFLIITVAMKIENRLSRLTNEINENLSLLGDGCSLFINH
jgi:hypothetical protein